MFTENEKFIIIDTETANSLDDPIMYDLGYAIIDRYGKVYEQKSFIIAETFFDHALMTTAYYADKMQQYIAEINAGAHTLAMLKDVKDAVYKAMTRYNVRYAIAHNARFDYRSTNTTQRYMTSSKYRYFFKYGTQFLDTLKMAREVFGKDTAYKAYCKENGFVCKNGAPRYTAEVLYRYISGNQEFNEAHTALADVMIEKEIFAECVKRNPEVDGLLW